MSVSLAGMVRENWNYVGHGRAVFYVLSILLTALAYGNFIFDFIHAFRSVAR